MWIRDEIAAAVARTGVRATELDDGAAQAAEQRAAAFAVPGTEALWERLRDAESLHDADAWRRIAEFVAAATTLFVRDAQGLCAFRFENGHDLVRTLGECSGFPFYVTDDTNRYLLAFNDHDMLIGSGEAAGWVRRLHGPVA